MGREDTLRLVGWSKPRRVVLIRRVRKFELEDDKNATALCELRTYARSADRSRTGALEQAT